MKAPTNYKKLLRDKKKLDQFRKDASREIQSRVILKYGLQNNEYHSLIVKLGITPPSGKRTEGLGVMRYINDKPLNWYNFDFNIMIKACERAGL